MKGGIFAGEAEAAISMLEDANLGALGRLPHFLLCQVFYTGVGSVPA